MGMDIAGLGSIAQAAKGIADKFWPDKTEVEKAKLAMELQLVMNDYNLVSGQQDINKIEAASPSIFVSGWRPAVGWICATALAYAAIVEPTLRFIATVIFKYAGAFPVIDTTLTLQILLGLLGIAGMRTLEKREGVARIK